MLPNCLRESTLFLIFIILLHDLVGISAPRRSHRAAGSGPARHRLARWASLILLSFILPSVPHCCLIAAAAPSAAASSSLLLSFAVVGYLLPSPLPACLRLLPLSCVCVSLSLLIFDSARSPVSFLLLPTPLSFPPFPPSTSTLPPLMIICSFFCVSASWDHARAAGANRTSGHGHRFVPGLKPPHLLLPNSFMSSVHTFIHTIILHLDSHHMACELAHMHDQLQARRCNGQTCNCEPPGRQGRRARFSIQLCFV